MVSQNSFIREMIEKFKALTTVSDWKKNAQKALEKKAFLIQYLDDLHRIERAEAENAPQLQRGAPMPQRSPFPQMPQQPGQGVGYQPQGKPSPAMGYGARQPSPAAEPAKQTSLAELMNMVRQQQQQTQQ